MTSEDTIAKRLAAKFKALEYAKEGNAWTTGGDRSSFLASDGTKIKARGSVRGPGVAIRRDDGDWQVFPTTPEGEQGSTVIVDRRDRSRSTATKFTFTIGFGGYRHPQE